MKVTTMTASHAFGKGKPDPSFSSAGNAGTAIAKYGRENVVDATLGVLKDDDGNFLSLPTVEKVYRALPADDLMDYAPIEGLHDFMVGATEFIFQGHQPKGTYTSGVATMGGSGGIRHMIYNYVDEGQTFLIPTWHWGPYREMATEYHRKWEMYEMFDKDDHFNIAGMKPNFIIAMYCLAILLVRPKVGQAAVIGLLAGAVCQVLPGTPYINFISELCGATAMGALILLPMKLGKLDIKAPVATFVSTVISGSVYTVCLFLFAGADASAMVAYVPIVLCTAVINTVIVQALYLPLRKVLKKGAAAPAGAAA